MSGDGKVLNKRGRVLGLLHSNNNNNSCNLDILPASQNCASMQMVLMLIIDNRTGQIRCLFVYFASPFDLSLIELTFD